MKCHLKWYIYIYKFDNVNHPTLYHLKENLGSIETIDIKNNKYEAYKSYCLMLCLDLVLYMFNVPKSTVSKDSYRK